MKAYQLKVAVKGSKPPIWRRCIIPSGITFSQLSTILNRVMGWAGYHQFEFEFYHMGLHIFEDIDDFNFVNIYDFAEASGTYIREYMETNGWFTYTYDLGDCWDHRVTIEKIIPDYDQNYPLVVKYKGECPLEDSGGIGGYYQKLEIMSDPGHPEHEEICDWAKLQGYEEAYDINEVNQVLAQECFFVWGKGETRCQDEIEEGFLEGEFGLRVTKSDKNKKKPVRSHRHAAKDSVNEFANSISQMVQRMNKIEIVTLPTIFKDFDQKILREIAKDKGIVIEKPVNKAQLVDKLCEKMLEPDELRRYFSYLTRHELEAFEQAVRSNCVHESPDFDKLYQGAYLGVLENGCVVVPMDVYGAYRKIKGSSFDEEQSRRSRLFTCFDVAEAIYGIVPAEVLLKLWERSGQTPMTLEELMDEAEAIPVCYRKFVYKRGKFIHQTLGSQAKDLERNQGTKEFYIPSQEEILDLEENGYFSKDRFIRKFISFLIRNGDVRPDLAEAMAQEIQYVIRSGGNVQEVMDVLRLGGVMFHDMDDIDEAMGAVGELWNHTRMILNRGFTPAEMSGGGEVKPPVFRVLDGDGEKVRRKEKKIYPNDPCPCGSGKKYKVCCGRRK